MAWVGQTARVQNKWYKHEVFVVEWNCYRFFFFVGMQCCNLVCCVSGGWLVLWCLELRLQDDVLPYYWHLKKHESSTKQNVNIIWTLWCQAPIINVHLRLNTAHPPETTPLFGTDQMDGYGYGSFYAKGGAVSSASALWQGKVWRRPTVFSGLYHPWK